MLAALRLLPLLRCQCHVLVSTRAQMPKVEIYQSYCAGVVTFTKPDLGDSPAALTATTR